MFDEDASPYIVWELRGELWNPYAQEYEEAIGYGDFGTRNEAAKAAQRYMEHPKDRFYAHQAVGESRSVQYGSPISFEGEIPEKCIKRLKANRPGIHPDWLVREVGRD